MTPQLVVSIGSSGCVASSRCPVAVSLPYHRIGIHNLERPRYSGKSECLESTSSKQSVPYGSDGCRDRSHSPNRRTPGRHLRHPS
jgi:hypothetical protein